MYYPIPPSSRKPMQHPVPKREAEIDLYIDPIVSWRCWSVDFGNGKLDDGLVLRSITYKAVWLKRKPSRAHCLQQWAVQNKSGYLPRKHTCPDLEHGCGFYSVKEPGQAIEWATNGTSTFRVIGTVKIWGSVFRFTEGYMSEYAYPNEIYVSKDYSHWAESPAKPDAEPVEIARLIEDAYAIDVHIGWPDD